MMSIIKWALRGYVSLSKTLGSFSICNENVIAGISLHSHLSEKCSGIITAQLSFQNGGKIRKSVSEASEYFLKLTKENYDCIAQLTAWPT